MENTKTRIRPQDVSRVMRNAGLLMSKELKARICYISTCGWEVKKDFWGAERVKIEWNPGHWERGREQKEEQFEKLAKLLTEKGYKYTFALDRFTVEGKN